MEDEYYADEQSEDEGEIESSSDTDDQNTSDDNGDSSDSESDKDTDDASSSSGVGGTSLWTKGNTFNPTLPECTYKKSIFDSWDLSANSTPLEVFRHFIDDELIEEIRTHTNLYTLQGGFKNWKEVSSNELWIFLGLHVLMGVVKKPSYKDYFTTDPLLSTPIFSECISRDRFFSILRALHFVDNKSKDATSHRLNKLGSLLPKLSTSFKQTIQPGEYLCVDESLLLFKGRLSFLQYIPSKRARFGVKFYCLVDCETKFLVKIIPYTGKTTQIDRDIMESVGFGGATVVTMMQDYLHEHRKVVVDNFFTSPKLLDYLRARQTYVLGTVRKNRKEMPIGISAEKLEKGGTVVYCTKDKCVVRWKDRRDVYMLCNFIKHEMLPVPSKAKTTDISAPEPPSKRLKASDEPKLKPATVLKYNSTMGGVDDVDRQIVLYVAQRKSMKWYKKVAFHLFDLSLYNSHIVHQRVSGEKMEYKKFIIKIVSKILHEFKTMRLKVGRRAHYEDPAAVRLNGSHVPIQVPNSSGKMIQRRCRFCVLKNRRFDTTYSCKTCNTPLCNKQREGKSCFDLYHSLPNLPHKPKA